MKAAIAGFGAMGRETSVALKKRGIPFVTIDPIVTDADFRERSEKALAGVDVILDFTRPQEARANLAAYIAAGKNVVMGTTGWYSEMGQVRDEVEKAGIGFIWASNFSIGVQLYLKIVSETARLVDSLPDYDVFVREIHHARKADSPSGTALSVAKAIMRNLSRKTTIVADALKDRKIEPAELHVSSARGGYVPGTHEVIVDGEADTIELRHIARNRAGMAAGAAMAAEFIYGKRGFFGIDDLMASIFGE
jgi:4-hydroxy-tetrahydrodipicolinate reductase